MSARHKLNQSYIHGALVVASVIGVVCESWTIFLIAATILVGLSLQSGEIRLTSRRRGNRRPPTDHRP